MYNAVNPRLKNQIRSLYDKASGFSGFLHICERRMRYGLTILMYHRVLSLQECNEYTLESLPIPINAFRMQMQWLSQNCKVLPVHEAVAVLACGRRYEKPLVSVTFDDGYADNYEIALPVLEEHGLRATFFITTNFVKEQQPLWYDRAADAWFRMTTKDCKKLMNSLRSYADPSLSRLNGIQKWMSELKSTDHKMREELVKWAESLAGGGCNSDIYRPMTIGQIRELRDRGHEIGSHTVTHPILPQLDDKSLMDELNRSICFLREWIGDDIKGFCYPNGDFDERVERAVEKSGYVYACTMQSGFNRPGSRLTRLLRLPVTMRRMVRSDGSHDELGFRAELCRLREWWR